MGLAIPVVTRIQDQVDVNVSLSAGVDEYALCWDNDAAKFVLRDHSHTGAGPENTAVGVSAGLASTTGTKCVWIGYQAGQDNTTGYHNVGVGWEALWDNTTGYDNTGCGVATLRANTTGIQNTAVGKSALHDLLDGYQNTAIGAESQYKTVSGTYNTTVGAQSMGGAIVSGGQNTGVGYNVLNLLVDGSCNTVVGSNGLAALVSGNFNVALGYETLKVATGSSNTAVGALAAHDVTSGASNTAVGAAALSANLTGSGNVALGNYAGAYETGSNAFYVDNQDRTNTAGDKAGALLYGTFAATAATQTLTVNAGTITLNGAVSAAGNFAVNKDAGSAIFTFTSNSTTYYEAPYGIFRRSRGTLASPAATQYGDVLGVFNFQGYQNSDWRIAADIVASAEGVYASAVDGHMMLRVSLGGTPYSLVELGSTGLVINNGGNASMDTTIKGDNYDALFVDASADSLAVMNNASGLLGFYAHAPIAQAVLATGAGATVDNVITALQNLGLVKQA